MSRISMIILGMFIQGVCEFLSMVRGFAQETLEDAKLKYFHTYNRLLILGCVIYYYVLLLKNAEQLYSAKVTIKKTNIAGANNLAAAEMKIKCQLTKYQMCIGCKACASVCKHNAISVHTFPQQDDDDVVMYRIDDEKCVRCTECVDHFNAGCYMRKVLTINQNDS